MRDEFINFASGILAETNTGLSGNKIATLFSGYAVKFGREIPFPNCPFDAPNKKAVFEKNLKVFEEQEQYQIIKETCESDFFVENDEVKKIKNLLRRDYAFLDSDFSDRINTGLIEETKHWLENYDKAYKLYNEALEKYSANVYDRNTLDDIRLSLELMLKEIFSNEKSLENQMSEIGNYIKEKGGSGELKNMLLKLIDYFCVYNNNHIKHDYNINEKEIEIMIELASTFMKYLIKID